MGASLTPDTGSRRPGVDDTPYRDLSIDASGRAVGGPVERIPSPNFDARPDACDPTLVVVHSIALPPGVFGGRDIDALFTNTLDPTADPYYAGVASLRVSSHFLVRRDGALVQFVDCTMRAWHAGISSYDGRARCNDYSIGIELEGDDVGPFEALQYATLAPLLVAIVARYPIVGIAAHSDIAPGRKTDPGPGFDWSRVAATVGRACRLGVDASR